MEHTRKQALSTGDSSSLAADESLLLKKKWKCAQCTYENWPSALKCTICLASKSTAVATSGGGSSCTAAKKTATVVKMASNKKQKQQQQAVGPSIYDPQDSNLIELNFNSASAAKVKKMSASLQRKHASVGQQHTAAEDSTASVARSEDIYQLMLGGSSDLISSCKESPSSPSLSSSCNIKSSNPMKNSKPIIIRPPPLLTPPLEAQPGSSSSLPVSAMLIGGGASVDEKELKWNCLACTYLNWPKSIKCVQCYTPRGISHAAETEPATEASLTVNPQVGDREVTAAPENVLSTQTTTTTTTTQNGEIDAALVLSKSSGTSNEETETADVDKSSQNAAAATAAVMHHFSAVSSPLDRSLCNSPCTVPKALVASGSLHGDVTMTTTATTTTTHNPMTTSTVSEQGDDAKELNASTTSTTAEATTTVAVPVAAAVETVIADTQAPPQPPPIPTPTEPTSSSPLSVSQTNSSSSSSTTTNTTTTTSTVSTSSSSSCIIDDLSKKWSCTTCTYQNWPKSQRCVMCTQPRQSSVSSQHTNNTGSTSSPGPHTSSGGGGGGARSTTPQSVSSTSNPTKQPQPQQQANNINAHVQQPLYQQQQQQIQAPMDRLFLAACQGVVDGNMNYLQRFINAGGELTRALTPDEVAWLNKGPTNLLMFNMGHTLIHLCCQYKRQEFLIQILNKESQSSKKIYPNAPSTTSNNNMYNLRNSMYIGGRTSTSKSSSKSMMIKAKFSPCQSCPQLAANIVDRYFTANLRQRKTPVDHQPSSSGGAASASGGAGAMAGGATSSPTSSLISLNASSSGSGSGTNNNNNNNNNQAYIQFSKASFHSSPSPSPPPGGCYGAGAASVWPSSSSSASHQMMAAGFCHFVNECHTFSLPNEIEDLSPKIQKMLFDELLDRDVEKELEIDARIINWSGDICKRLNSRLYPLWNRHSGDCLLDSVLQACYGVFDTDNTLRRAMAESLEQYSHCFKPRWKEHELSLAQSLDYTLDDNQLEQDWANVLALAYQPGASLEQAHIFALCHIFRRPIIIYSVKYVKSLRGENIGFTHFEGVYLPLNWEPSFCFKNPIALGYTRGHFTALVPLERNEINFGNGNSFVAKGAGGHGGAQIDHHQGGAVSCHLDHSADNQQQQVFYLPLTNSDGQLLPVHFLTCAEVGKERALLRQYLQVDCLVTQANGCGLYVAHQRVAKRPMLVRQMVEEWLTNYRNMQSREIGYQIEICANDENEQNCNQAKSPASLQNHHHNHHHHHQHQHLQNSGSASVNASMMNNTSSPNGANIEDEDDEEDDEDDDDEEDEEEEEEEEEEEDDEDNQELDDLELEDDEIVVVEDEDDDDDDDEYCVREEL